MTDLTRPEQLYTIAQAARLNALSLPTIRRLIPTGAIAIVKNRQGAEPSEFRGVNSRGFRPPSRVALGHTASRAHEGRRVVGAGRKPRRLLCLAY